MEGWSNIILKMKEKLKHFNEHIIELKEKWGILKINYHFKRINSNKNKTRKIIDKAEDKSSTTCEICGNPGEIFKNHEWLRTLCNNCRTQTDNQYEDPYPLSSKPDDIQRWIQQGKARGATHLIEMTDSFDWQDYPVYVMPGEDLEKVKAEQIQDMVYVSRVTDLRG